MTSTHDLMLDFAEQLDDMEERMSRIESRIVQLMYALRLDPNGRYDGKNPRTSGKLNLNYWER